MPQLEEYQKLLIFWPTVVEFVLFSVAFTLLVMRASWQARQALRLKEAIGEAYRSLLEYLTLSSEGVEPAQNKVLSLPPAERLRLIGGLTKNLEGAERERLKALAEATHLVDIAKEACQDHRWWYRLQGIRSLVALGQSALIPEVLIEDPNGLVRTEAVYLLTARGPEGVEQMIGLLGRPTLVAQFTVQDALLRCGPRIGEPLARALQNRSFLEPLRGLEAGLEVAALVADPVLLPVGLQLCDEEHPGVRARAARLLGAVGGEEATDRLRGLLLDTADEVCIEAVTSLGRLGAWKAVPELGKMLERDSWPVRKAAGLALRQVGPPGRLYLQRLSQQREGVASEMARHVLSLPKPEPEAEP